MEQPSVIVTNTTTPVTKPDHTTPEITNVGPKKPLSRLSSTASLPADHFESNTQTDWNVASNDSTLLSIHASFKNKHPYWRSGELGAPDDQASTSDHMFSYSAQHPEIMRSRELGLLAEETMKDVIRESETTNRTCHVARSLALVSRASRGSSSSIKSFAFSIKGGDGDSSRTHSSVRSASEEQEPVEPQVTAQPQPPLAHRDQKKDLAPMAKTAWPKRWFRPVFSCCSLWLTRS